MPYVSIKNDLDEDIHVAFCVMGFPAIFGNNLGPGQRWTTTRSLATLPHTLEVRRVGNNKFSQEESLQMLGTIGGACAAGTASVLTAVLAPAKVSLLASPALMGAASQGLLKYEFFRGSNILMILVFCPSGGSAYANWGADMRILLVTVWVAWFAHKTYSVRREGSTHCLWDIQDGCRVG